VETSGLGFSFFKALFPALLAFFDELVFVEMVEFRSFEVFFWVFGVECLFESIKVRLDLFVI
jgi:hypothetical protein